tara:strand:- start:4634 stop:5203 length:570 start_codon:yes stop_codon:yes gene_type:complete
MAKSEMKGVAKQIKSLRAIEPELSKKMRREMRTNIQPILNPIEAQINSQVEGALRGVRDIGMFHGGRTQWGGVKVKVKATIRPTDIVYIEGKGGGGDSLDGALGFEYAELAGINRRPPRAMSKGWGSTSTGYHSYIQNGQGAGFSRMLGRFGKPGRFLFSRVIKYKPAIEMKVKMIVSKYEQIVNTRNS